MAGVVRTFRLEEANALLPRVSALVNKMLAARREAAVARLELLAVGTRWPQGVRTTQLMRRVRDYEALVVSLIEEIHGLGGTVKDLDLGLVDFPAQAGGEIVNLCWKVGEPEIAYWHRWDEGFAWRKPLTDLPA
jgi:hypothetical protein